MELHKGKKGAKGVTEPTRKTGEKKRRQEVSTWERIRFQKKNTSQGVKEDKGFRWGLAIDQLQTIWKGHQCVKKVAGTRECSRGERESVRGQ